MDIQEITGIVEKENMIVRQIAAEVEKEGGDIVANNYRRKAEGVEEALKILLMSQ